MLPPPLPQLADRSCALMQAPLLAASAGEVL
jgi:hypothetical protein